MEGKQCVRVLIFISLVSFFAVFFSITAVSAAQQPTAQQQLTNADCVKCHAGPPADIAANGGKHATITCQDCHVGHPPAVPREKVIPSCSECHGGKPHYELKGCLSCHRNPHTPLVITVGSNVTDPCLTCHSQEIKQLTEHKSKHTSLYCSTCHPVHGKVPQCLQCHKPHSSDMVQADCNKCHKAHMPTVVAYGDVPSKDCGACHKRAFELLTGSKAKHRTFNCSFCHQAKHKMIPECEGCHGTPHPAGIMAKFTKCGDCHHTAHDLNNWTSVMQKETPQTETPKKERKKK